MLIALPLITSVMAFYGWTEEYEQILDQCLPRRSPNCCIYHSDQIARSSVEEIAKVLGEDNTEDGVVVSSILGAACTCEDYEFSSPYDLVTLHSKYTHLIIMDTIYYFISNHVLD